MATTHTVVKGDTLWGIAQKYLGSGSKYTQLAAINNISNPNLIYIGQVIKLTNTGGSSSSSKVNTNCPVINQFGVLSSDENTLFATWSWGRANTESYKVSWTYDTGNGVWFSGNNSSITVDKDEPSLSRQSTFSIPNGAKRVRFKVKPISEKKKTNGDTETYIWTANWSDTKTWTDSTPLETPAVPTVSVEKYKITAELSNVKIDATHIEFHLLKDNKTLAAVGSAKINTTSQHVSYTWTVAAGSKYKVKCRARKGSSYSEWTDWSSEVSTMPSSPSGITQCKGTSETSVYLAWSTVSSADTYDIEYTTKKDYFDGSDQTSTKTGIEGTHFEITGLETGSEYFFRVRAVNAQGASPWSGIKSVIIGKDPSAPTTWSSTTTVITGEELTLYWVHNAEDGSSQTYAELELTINGVTETKTIKNSTDEDEKDKTSSYVIDTTKYNEGVTIQWRVRTAGITKAYGDWSTQRTVDVYAPPTLDLNITNKNGENIEEITGFPFYISAIASPNTQVPISYHVSITSNEIYETVDNVGNDKTVNSGEEVYSKYFDITDALTLEISAQHVNLENNISYTATVTVTMNSGLTTEASKELTVRWEDVSYLPNAEVGIDEDTLVAYVRPYCEELTSTIYKVTANYGTYTRTSDIINSVYGNPVNGASTTTGEQVYSGTDGDGNSVYYCLVETATMVEDVTLAVYRREFDGTFTEIGSGLENIKNTTVTDPHPALDFARYRIIATTKSTGAVSYYDLPGYPVQEKSVIIQWDEEWSMFEAVEDAELAQPPWSGSMLKLPYNIDVSDSISPDVSHVEYIGRRHPVAYYGTQVGETSSWSVAIEKSDKETLYALRRLRIYMGDVYVREPSGSGYWASVKVTFNQNHCELTIPVTLDITRVEGGM